MAQWIPPPDMEVADVIDRLAREIAGMYADAEDRLTRIMILEGMAGIQRPGRFETTIRMGHLRAAAREIADEVQLQMPILVDGVVKAAATGGAQAALMQMAALSTVVDITQMGDWATGSVASNLVKADLFSAVEKLHMRILRFPDDVYRQSVGKYVTDSILGLSTNRQAQAEVWRDLVGQGVTGFVDKAGRRWNLSTYSEMATRTATMRAWDDAHQQQASANGMDLVTPIVARDACEKCGRWAGTILAVNGTAGTYQVEHATEDHVYITVEVDASVEDARADGWKHPNCRCPTVVYLPGLSLPKDSSGYDEKLEGDREGLRAQERAVRKAKRDLNLAMDPVEERAARDHLNKARANIRQIVEDTPQMRKRYREQTNLGFRRKTPA